MLIESDKRGINIRLTYGKELFSVPKNLYIIGIMNTADRSLAVIDYALRRRFAFYNVKPAFDSVIFKNHIKKNKKLLKVVECIKQLNVEIQNCESLGAGFQIGHSFFCGKNIFDGNDNAIKDILIDIFIIIEISHIQVPSLMRNVTALKQFFQKAYRRRTSIGFRMPTYMSGMRIAR